MPYYQTGDTSGSIEVPIVLQEVSVSGGVFLGNIAIQMTATSLGDYGSGSTFPVVETGLNYWDGATWQKVSGSSGSMKVELTSSNSAPLWVSGVLLVQDPELPLNTANTYMFAPSTASVLFIGSNQERKQLSVFNGTDGDMYIALSATADTGSYTIKIPPSAYFELTTTNGVYAGPVSGIWGAMTIGSASVTEVTL